MADLIVDDPYSLTEAARVQLADAAAVDRTLDAARAAARAWARIPLAERVALCLRAVDAMEAARDDIAADVTRMMGKPLRQARNEVAGMAKRARWMIGAAEAALADLVLDPEGGRERRIVREPHGVVFSLPAWNYPLLTAVNVVVPAVLAGNVVVLKHSPRSPALRRALRRAPSRRRARPPAWCRRSTATTPTSERIAGDARVDHVAFTGSVYGGHRIYAAAAATRFVEVGLELGGKDPAYVAADADLARAVDGIVDGACYNAGQSCCAVERAYVHRSLYDRFVEAALAQMRAYVLGDPTRRRRRWARWRSRRSRRSSRRRSGRRWPRARGCSRGQAGERRRQRALLRADAPRRPGAVARRAARGDVRAGAADRGGGLRRGGAAAHERQRPRAHGVRVDERPGSGGAAGARAGGGDGVPEPVRHARPGAAVDGGEEQREGGDAVGAGVRAPDAAEGDNFKL